MALTAVNLDIFLGEAPSPIGYVAKATTADGRTTSQQALNLATLLGPVALSSIYNPDQPAPENGSDFVNALIKLRDRFDDRATIETVGDGLFKALPDEVRALYYSVWSPIATDRTKLLRVRLHFDKAELGMLPWEYMKVGDMFFCEHPRRSLLRYPDTGEPLGKLEFAGPLKVLLWAANPIDTEPLQFQNEVEKITQRLKERLGANVQIDLVLTGGPQDLLDKLEAGGYHVWHYIGHGTFDTTLGEGVLIFQPTEGAPARRVAARQLRSGLIDNSTLKLVFLNSCETAVGSLTNAYASLGLNLARFTPSVIAMQAAVNDDSAIVLAQKFYQELSAGRPLDVCLTRGRQALIAEFGDQMDWGIPALFTRADLDTVVADEVRSNAPPPANNNSDAGRTPATTATTGWAANPNLKSALVNTLVQAFPSRSDLAQLTDFYLGTSLNAIPSDGNDIGSLVLGVVNWTQSAGGDYLARLLDGAITMRPARADLPVMREQLVAAGLIAGGGQASTTNNGGTGNTTPAPVNTPPTNTEAAPAIPTIEPPPMAAFSNGRLSLTPQGRRLFTQTIANMDWAATASGRDGLLQNLPQGLKGGVSRSDVAQLHIGSIINTSESWGKMTGGPFAGKYALIVLADTAADLSGFGTDSARQGAEIFMALANAMRDRVGQPPAALPFDN